MNRVILMAAALALTAGGCGDPKPLPMAATPESSRAALTTALDGWKSGKSFQDLLNQNPPVIFQDDDLNRGLKLLDYKIEGEGKPNGTAYSYVVSLTFESRERPKKVYYSAVSEPKLAVTREDRSP